MLRYLRKNKTILVFIGGNYHKLATGCHIGLGREGCRSRCSPNSSRLMMQGNITEFKLISYMDVPEASGDTSASKIGVAVLNTSNCAAVQKFCCTAAQKSDGIT